VIRLLRQAVIAELASPGELVFDFGHWRMFHDAVWKQALDWLDLSGLALYFWQKFRSIDGQAALPPLVEAHLARCHEDNCSRVSAIKAESAKLNSLFEHAGVRYALLKGIALTPDYCPDPTLRTQYDHDYLIRPDSLARAEEALQKAEYTPRVSGEDRHIAYFGQARDGASSKEPAGLYSARLGRPIELHIRLWDRAEENFEVEVPNDLLGRARRCMWQCVEYWALSEEDGLLFQVLHAFRHILRNWCRLSIFLEISHFLRKRASDADFWARYCSRTRSLRWVPEAGAVVFGLAERLFGSGVPPEVKAHMKTRFCPVMDLWIERYGVSAALLNFRNNKHSLFLHREFVDDASTWKGFLKRRLIPVRRPHRLPCVLNRSPRVWGRRWSQWRHALQRFKFHFFSLLAFAWEYPRWHVVRARRVMVCPKPAAV